MLGFCLGFGLLVKFGAGWLLRNTPTNAGACATTSIGQAYERFLSLRPHLETTWLCLLPVCLIATPWGSSLHVWELESGLQGVSLALWFLPSVLALSLIELVAAQFDHLHLSCRTSFDNWELDPNKARRSEDLATGSKLGDWAYWNHWLLRLRLGSLSSLLSCTAPILMIGACSDLLLWFELGLGDEQRTALASAISLVCIVAWLPVWLGYWMGARPLTACDTKHSELLARIHQLQSKAELPHLKIMLVHSNQRWAGAAVVGWIPKCRQLWIGDGLLDRLNCRELEMVVLHEYAHVVRWHFVWRLLPVMWSLVAAVAVSSVLHSVLPDAESLIVTIRTVVVIVASLVMLIGIGWMARKCELDADEFACNLARRNCEWTQFHSPLAPAALASALKKLMSESPSAASSSWLHPSLEARLRNLAQIADHHAPITAVD